MKLFILFALFALSVGFVSCRKSGVSPSNLKMQDTLSDSALFKVQLVSVKDTLPRPSFAGRTEMLIHFNHAYHLSFNNGFAPDYDEDAPPGPSFPGPADAALSVFGMTTDGRQAEIDGIPYKAGVTVPLQVTCVSSGQFVLRAYYLRWFPADIHIWCKDNYLKDSVDLRKENYNFSIDRTDPNQFGIKRFSIILGPK